MHPHLHCRQPKRPEGVALWALRSHGAHFFFSSRKGSAPKPLIYLIVIRMRRMSLLTRPALSHLACTVQRRCAPTLDAAVAAVPSPLWPVSALCWCDVAAGRAVVP